MLECWVAKEDAPGLEKTQVSVFKLENEYHFQDGLFFFF